VRSACGARHCFRVPKGASYERHFVPGVGLVREIIVVALGGDLLSRQEMVLQK
jgi:hypothetical protein